MSNENLKLMGFTIGEETSLLRASKETLASHIEEAVAHIKAKYFKRGSGAGKITKPKRIKENEEKEMTVYIGWKTRDKNKCRRKTKKGGGGIKEIKVLKKDSSYETILSMAKFIFLGETPCEANLKLNGEEITSFYDSDGKEVTYANYLKLKKMYASR